LNRELLRNVRVVLVDSAILHVYRNLCQSYEGEFSAITGKKPDQCGMFALDTEIGGCVDGWLLYEGDIPIGFAALRHDRDDAHEVCEFYVVPSRRCVGAGKYFAHTLFAHYTGRWEVKQLPDAVKATRFWRNVIGSFGSRAFEEDIVVDAYWGQVTRQRFCSSCCITAG
jgi:predicted acetyltransferase